MSDCKKYSVLHIANWYPNSWNSMEGNFTQDHIRLFSHSTDGQAIVVQVRQDKERLLKLIFDKSQDGVPRYYAFTRVSSGKVIEVITTLLLLFALIRVRAWKFDVLHFHIAYPLLAHVRFWRWLFCKPILISEHWTAYHYNFYLPEGSKKLKNIRRPFEYGFPVFTVSRALLEDIQKFSGRDDFPGYVIPNVVPIHGVSPDKNPVPVFFTVNHWVKRKDPIPMLEGFAKAAAKGADFELVIGGYGEMVEPMKTYVEASELKCCTNFLGTMTKQHIAKQLGKSDGYVFSSLYETFSVACAESLGAGVPLIGPYIPAISEYASEDDWFRVDGRECDDWACAVAGFVEKVEMGGFNKWEIAERAANFLSYESIRAAYRSALDEVLLNEKKTIGS